MKKLVYFEDLQEGAVFWGAEVTADREEMLEYARRNDPWPMHIDEEAARNTPFGGLIASGGYTISLLYRSSHGIYNTPDVQWAFLGGFDWHVKFLKAVRPGERFRLKMTIQGKRLSDKPGRGIINSLSELVNQKAEVVHSVEAVWLIATRPPAATD